ncbi:hypothetical protein CVT26_009017 [Gymnopilus dilepis]|uniref:HMG box domain-containing protein n=1 Tax=Gymnopilus dilepis TaxID=231916 RepID=A0A409YB73_9AGAR|nr:hypothetical protein CVT26_009017 [Gymnopilus dilepis]
MSATPNMPFVGLIDFNDDHHSSVPSNGSCTTGQIASEPRPTRRHSRKKNPNYIPRPRNAFMFFRSFYAKTFKGAGSAGPQSMLSKQAGRAWAGLSPAEKKEYKDMERIDKLVHKAMYPDYVYSPRRTTSPKAKGSSGRRKHKRSSSSSTSSDYSDPSDILVSNSRSPFQRDLVDDQAILRFDDILSNIVEPVPSTPIISQSGMGHHLGWGAYPANEFSTDYMSTSEAAGFMCGLDADLTTLSGAVTEGDMSSVYGLDGGVLINDLPGLDLAIFDYEAFNALYVN